MGKSQAFLAHPAARYSRGLFYSYKMKIIRNLAVLGIPQVAEKDTPRSKDVAGECLL